MEELARQLAALSEDLDNLRLMVKYLVFDLEATKRENAILREQNEEIIQANIDLSDALSDIDDEDFDDEDDE